MSQVCHRPLLRVEHRRRFQCVGDLEHEPDAARALDQEVLVTLTRQRTRGTVDAVAFTRQLGSKRGVEAGNVIEHVRLDSVSEDGKCLCAGPPVTGVKRHRRLDDSGFHAQHPLEPIRLEIRQGSTALGARIPDHRVGESRSS